MTPGAVSWVAGRVAQLFGGDRGKIKRHPLLTVHARVIACARFASSPQSNNTIMHAIAQHPPPPFSLD